MSSRSRTGGGVGSNQHGPKGVSKQQPPKPTSAIASGVGGGAVTADPLDMDATLPDPDADAYAERIWRGDAGGFSEADIRGTLDLHRKMLDDLNAGRITPRSVVGTGYKKPKEVAREWLAGQIDQGERDLASRGRTNAVNRRNAGFAVFRRRQGEEFAAALADAPSGLAVPGEDGSIECLAQRRLIVHGSQTISAASSDAAESLFVDSVVAEGDEQARLEADSDAWRRVAEVTTPLCDTVADHASFAAEHGRDPLRAAANVASDWLADRGLRGHATIDHDHVDGPRVVARLL